MATTATELTELDKAIRDRGKTLFRRAKYTSSPVKFAFTFLQLETLIEQAEAVTEQYTVSSEIIALMKEGRDTLAAAHTKLAEIEAKGKKK